MKMYCIEHGEVYTEQSPVGECHSFIYWDDLSENAEIDWCFFEMGWATCPPPEWPDDWADYEPELAADGDDDTDYEYEYERQKVQVTRDMAIDAGDRSLEGQWIEW